MSGYTHGAMGLTRRFVAALIVGIVIVFGIGAGVTYRREVALFDSDVRDESVVLGHALARGLAMVWERDGERAGREFLADASDPRGPQVRWVWLDSPVGSIDGPAAPLAPLGGQTLVRRRESAGVIDTYVPVAVPGPRQGALELSETLDDERGYIHATLRNDLISAVLLALVGAGMAWWVGVYFVGRPVSKLVAKARRVGAGDLGGPLLLGHHDELGELAVEMNGMCERLAAAEIARSAAEAQLRHAERLTTVGKLASGLAHELGTPLNVVAGRARMVADGELLGDEAQASARVVLDQTERMTRLIRQLLDFARPPPPAKTMRPLRAIVERIVVLLGPMSRDAGVSLRVIDGDAVAEVDEAQLQQVVTNLVVNALHATGPDGVVTIDLSEHEATAPADLGGRIGRWAVVTVKDTGIGMDAATRGRVFEPFFTTKPAGDGTGLGLSVSWGIVREHGGWIDLHTEPGRGSELAVYLPIAAATGARAGVQI